VTIRPRSLKAVQVARERLRDLAGADAHRTAAAAGVAAAAAAAAAVALDDSLDACRERMRAASITGLIRISADLETSRAEVGHAAADSEAMARAARVAVEALARRERELRTVERALELTRNAADALLAADEQRANDDLSARRRREHEGALVRRRCP